MNKTNMKHKKAIIVIVALSAVFAVAILACTMLLLKYKFRQARFAANEAQKVAVQQLSNDDEKSAQLLSSISDEDFPGDSAANANIALLVNDLDVSAESLNGVAQRHGAKVVSSDINFASSKLRSGIVIVQVPKNSFEDAISDIKGLSIKVVQENVRNAGDIDKEDLQSQLDVRRLEDEALSKVIDQAGNANDVIIATQRKEEIQVEIQDIEALLDEEKAANATAYVRVVLVENKAFSLASGMMIANPDSNIQMPNIKQQIAMWVLLGLRVFVTLLLAGLLAIGIVIIFRGIFKKRHPHKVVVKSAHKKTSVIKRSKVVRKRSL